MRKITFTLLSMFFVLPCMANIHINPDAVTEVVAKHFPNKQVECIREYNTQLKASNGSGIAASKLWNVCAAGGLDVKQPADKEKCRTFVNELARKGTVKFYEVCGKDKNMVEKGTGRCIDNVFSNKVLGAIKVNMLVATGLSKEYARVKYNDNNLMCSKNYRSTTLPPYDYVRCTSLNKNMTYEFRFDSVTSTTDYVIDEGTESGICKIYGVKYTPFGSKQATYLGNGQKVGDYESWPAACETTDAAKCSKINETMQKFGRTAKIGSTGSKGNKRNACIINKDAISPSNLRTAFGIDNYVFKKGGVQLNATTAVKDQVCAYVRQAVKSPTITSCICNDGFVHIYDFSGMITETDDVLTCKINNKTVDFVFDDLTEAWGVYDKSGHEAMNCIAWGGTFTGKKCIGLDEKMCNKVRDANAQSCPECKLIKWNQNTKTCDLPSSVSATNLKKGLNYTAIVGGAVVGVVITVGTLGTASAPTALILTGLAVETLGAGIELVAQVKIDAIADEFLIKSNQCKSASCAQSLIKDNFQHLADSQNDFSDAEISVIDSEMARLAGLIPDNSDFWADIALNSLSMEDNKSGMFDFEHWTPEQTWRAVGITLQLATVVTSVGKWVATKTKNVVTKLSKSSGVLKSKTQKAVSIVEHASDQRALTAKQLELQQKLRIINPNTLKGDDLELYNLWKKYAPRNQSFESFKKMGSLQEIRDMSKEWVAWDDIEQFNVIQKKIDRFFANHPGAFNEIATADDLTALEYKYPELFELYRQQDHLGDLSNLRLHTKGNYSTLDPTLNSKKIVYDDETTQAKLDKALKEYLHDSDPNADKRYQQKIIDAQIEYFSSKLQPQAVDEIAATRLKQFDDIINESPKLQDLRTRWYSLSNSEKLDFAQEMSDQLLLRNGVEFDKLPHVENAYLEQKTYGTFVSFFEPGTKNVADTKVKLDLSQIDSFSDFANTLAHEIGGHGVDALNPNAGIGSQLNYISSGLHGSNYNTYRLEPGEVNAWRTGNIVGDAYKPANPIE